MDIEIAKEKILNILKDNNLEITNKMLEVFVMRYEKVYLVLAPSKEEDMDWMVGCWAKKEHAEEYIKNHEDSKFLYIISCIVKNN